MKAFYYAATVILECRCNGIKRHIIPRLGLRGDSLRGEKNHQDYPSRVKLHADRSGGGTSNKIVHLHIEVRSYQWNLQSSVPMFHPF